MSYQLILLGLLAGQPRHGYEIKQTFEEGTLAEYLKVSGGGLYYNLHKLVKEGFVSEQNVEREGNYPDRHIYQITEEGRIFLTQLIADTFGDANGRKFFDPLDAALMFSTEISREAIVIRLQHQFDLKKGKLVQMSILYDSYKDAQDQGLSDPYMLLLLDHSIARLQSDVNWLESAFEKIKEDPAFEQAHQTKHHPALSVNEDMVVDEVRTPENTRKWLEYESRLQKALRRYKQQAEQAWREYEVTEKIFSGSPGQLETAQAVYRNKIADVWQAYDQETRQVRTEMGNWIKGVTVQ